jgi:polysaccharide biosynthesis protein PslH
MTNSQVRTLFLTNKQPYPPIGGAPLRNWQNIHHMMKYGPVGVFFLCAEHEQPDSAPVAPPGVALWRFQTVGKRPLVSKITRRVRLMTWLLTQAEPLTDMHYTPAVAEELDRIMTEFKPDVVVFEEIWLYCYLSTIQRHPCRIIFDAHNAETALFHQIFGAEEHQGLKNKLESGLRLALIERMERNFVRAADQVWTCSQEDADLLQSFSAKPALTSVIPNGIDVDSFEPVRSHAYTLNLELKPTLHTVIFTASFSYAPNALAAQFLIDQIYPKLQQAYPDCQLLLVGKDPTDAMLEAAKNDPSIVVTGKVPDVRPYLAAASVVLVPLLQGGGTRLKILEAFAACRPVVSTAKGAEGINAQDGEQILIRDDVEGLVAGISELWQDKVFAQKLASAAFDLVQAEYSWTAVGRKLDHAIAPLLGSPNPVSEVGIPV